MEVLTITNDATDVDDNDNNSDDNGCYDDSHGGCCGGGGGVNGDNYDDDGDTDNDGGDFREISRRKRSPLFNRLVIIKLSQSKGFLVMFQLTYYI